MGRKIPVQIGDLSFSSKGDALAHLREMLNRYRPGQDVSAEDATVLEAALQRHPDAKQKIGCGVTGFKVRSADFGSQCFWVMRTDGSTEDFSYKSCV